LSIYLTQLADLILLVKKYQNIFSNLLEKEKHMALKKRKDYLASLKKMRPNIYKFGELIEDVTTHPATKRTVESHA